MSIEITKAFLHKVKNGEGLIIHYKEADNDEVIKKKKSLVHKDLKNAFSGLEIHLAVICEYVTPTAVEIAAPDPRLTEKFFVHGYSIGGGEDSQGVTLTGHLILKNGLAHNFNTPFIRFDLAPEARYIFMDDLQAKIANIEQEIEEYLSGAKLGEPIQPELGFDEKVSPEAEHVSEADQYKFAGKVQMAAVAENGKKNGRKKVRQTAANPSGEIAE